MNKTEFEAGIAERTGHPKATVAEVLQAFQELGVEALLRDDNIRLTGWMTVSVKERPGRPGVNPKTGEAIDIAPKKKLTVRAGKDLDRALNG